MHPQHIREFFADQALSTDRRTLRLAWDEALQERFGPALLPQRAVITEGVCEPTEARIDGLSLSARLPLHGLPGEPVALQMLTDRGELRSFPLVLTEARPGLSDGGLTAVHWMGRDAMSLMDDCRRLRCFHQRSVPGVVDEVLRGWLADGLGAHFTWRWLFGRPLHLPQEGPWPVRHRRGRPGRGHRRPARGLRGPPHPCGALLICTAPHSGRP